MQKAYIWCDRNKYEVVACLYDRCGGDSAVEMRWSLLFATERGLRDRNAQNYEGGLRTETRNWFYQQRIQDHTVGDQPIHIQPLFTMIMIKRGI